MTIYQLALWGLALGALLAMLGTLAIGVALWQMRRAR